jgi:putative restriction endonuclease
MKEGQTLWTKEGSILALNLYSKIPFGQMHSRNSEVIELAELIDRSPSSIARRLGNFASLDPKLKERGIKGLENASKLDQQVWDEYMHDWDGQFIEGEKLLAHKKNTTVEKLYNVDLDNIKETEGKQAQRLVNVRLNQSIFRKLVLTNFDSKCCITGINITELLVASHILPWSVSKDNQTNPKNGLALNTLHDKAFDRGLITVTEDYKIKVSSILYKQKGIQSIKQNFVDHDGKELIMPKKFSPDIEFLRIHNDKYFRD